MLESPSVWHDKPIVDKHSPSLSLEHVSSKVFLFSKLLAQVLKAKDEIKAKLKALFTA